MWLSPIQATIIPIADRHAEQARKIKMLIEQENIRTSLDDRNETLGSKIRDATLQKVPYIGIIGDKEVKSSEESIISVRARGGKDLGQMKFSAFVNKLKEEIDKKI